MVKHNKYCKIILLTALLALSLCGCNKKNEDISKYDASVIATIYDSTYGSSTLYKDNVESYIYEVVDNKVANVINNSTKYEAVELMQLNENIGVKDITIKDEYSLNTWNATIDESSAHVKYLQDKGYTITRQVCTQEFIDLNLTKNNDTKRVLIYPDKILISSIEPKSFNIENYIKK